MKIEFIAPGSIEFTLKAEDKGFDKFEPGPIQSLMPMGNFSAKASRNKDELIISFQDDRDFRDYLYKKDVPFYALRVLKDGDLAMAEYKNMSLAIRDTSKHLIIGCRDFCTIEATGTKAMLWNLPDMLMNAPFSFLTFRKWRKNGQTAFRFVVRREIQTFLGCYYREEQAFEKGIGRKAMEGYRIWRG